MHARLPFEPCFMEFIPCLYQSECAVRYTVQRELMARDGIEEERPVLTEKNTCYQQGAHMYAIDFPPGLGTCKKINV